ncbi:MAG: type II secretion system protein [Oceanipulchritudo sp.]
MEIMIVVVIIGFLATMALPFLRKARLNTQYTRFMSDARVFAGAVETLYMASGVKPVDSNTGTIDPELAEYVGEDFFTRDSPIGGKWDVEADDSGIGLGVGVDGYTISPEQLQELDAKYDNGDLSSGKLVEIVSGRRYYWVLE